MGAYTGEEWVRTGSVDPEHGTVTHWHLAPRLGVTMDVEKTETVGKSDQKWEKEKRITVRKCVLLPQGEIAGAGGLQGFAALQAGQERQSCLQTIGRQSQQVSHNPKRLLVFTKLIFQPMKPSELNQTLWGRHSPGKFSSWSQYEATLGKGTYGRSCKVICCPFGLSSLNNLFSCLFKTWGRDSHLPSAREMSGQTACQGYSAFL